MEELDGVIETHCRTLGLDVTGKALFGLEGELSQNLVAEKLGLPVHTGKALDEPIPPRPPVMCAGCPHRGLFYTRVTFSFGRKLPFWKPVTIPIWEAQRIALEYHLPSATSVNCRPP